MNSSEQTLPGRSAKRTMKKIISTLLRIILLPFRIFLKAMLLIGRLITAFSSGIFHLIGTIFLITTFLNFGFGLASGPELKSMLITSLAILFAPLAAEIIVDVLDAVV